MAPEYFMNGRVSDKIDVYGFGVVLLELLSGRKPIGGEVPKGQESLVKWVRPSSAHTAQCLLNDCFFFFFSFEYHLRCIIRLHYIYIGKAFIRERGC